MSTMLLVLMGQQAGGGGGSSGPPGALDAYKASLWSCCGITRYLQSWTGALIRVQRSSDSAQIDVGWSMTDNSLDSATMMAWAGSDTVYVVRLYDQMGYGNDWIVNYGSGGIIASGGTYNGAFKMSTVGGSPDGMITANATPSTADLSLFVRKLIRARQTGADSLMVSDQLDVAGHTGFAWQYDPGQSQNVTYIDSGNGFTTGTFAYGFSSGSPTGSMDTDAMAMHPVASSSFSARSARNGSGTTFTNIRNSTLTQFTGEKLLLGGNSSSPSLFDMQSIVVYSTYLTQTNLNTISALL